MPITSDNMCSRMICKGTRGPDAVDVDGRTVTARALTYDPDS